VLLRQVSRTKIALDAFAWLNSRFVEVEANATYCPVVLMEGPAVERDGISLEHVASVPHIQLFACAPS
jgi:hypothetical protein